MSTLKRTDRHGVAYIEIDHPPLNLVGPELLSDLAGLLGALEADAQVRVVVFRSGNQDFFVNHFDLAPRPGQPPRPPGELNPLSAMLVRLSNLPQITIGELRGRSRGAGSEFVLALDLRFASLESAVLCQPEVGVGLHPGAGGTQRLAQLVGRGRALEICASAQDFDAATAERYGWVNRALPETELSAFVDKLAKRIASFPAIGLTNTKEMISSANSPDHKLLVEESDRFIAALGDEHVRERVAWLFARGAQTLGDTERNLADVVELYPAASDGADGRN